MELAQQKFTWDASKLLIFEFRLYTLWLSVFLGLSITWLVCSSSCLLWAALRSRQCMASTMIRPNMITATIPITI